MTKTIALFALTALMILTTLGNYWFTFGLWPRSWAMFVLFAVVQLTVTGALQAVMKEKS